MSFFLSTMRYLLTGHGIQENPKLLQNFGEQLGPKDASLDINFSKQYINPLLKLKKDSLWI